MIRSILSGSTGLVLVAILALTGSSAPSFAQNSVPPKPKTGSAAVSSKTAPAKTTLAKTAPAKTTTKPDPKKPGDKPSDSAPGKPQLVATFGDWGTYAAKVGTAKTCYALAQPKDRTPSNLKRDSAYIFISDRPAENVRNEVSIIMGFDVKGDAPAGAAAAPLVEVGSTKFSLVAKGSNLWLANAAEEGPMIAAMRKNAKLIVRAASLKGNMTTDDYSLSGLPQALDRMQKECR